MVEPFRMICLIIYVLAFSDCCFFVPLRIKFESLFRQPKKVAYGIIPPFFPRVVLHGTLGFFRLRSRSRTEAGLIMAGGNKGAH